MVAKAKYIDKVEGLGEVFQVAAPLDRQIASLKEAGVSHPYLVGVDDTAQIRLAGVSNDFTRTHVAPVALKGKPTLLYRPSDLMSPVMASLAVQCHKKGEYLEMPGEFYDVVEQRAKTEEGLEPEDRTAIILSKDGDFDLTPEMDESRFLFRKQVKPYFGKFTQGTIPFKNLRTDSKKAVVNYLWFGYPLNSSRLDCRNRDLYYDYYAFGVRRFSQTAEGGSQNPGYSLTEIGKANYKPALK